MLGCRWISRAAELDGTTRRVWGIRLNETTTSRGAEHLDRIPVGWAIGAVVAPALVIFVLPMVGLISRNEDFFHDDFGAGRTIYLWGAALSVIGVLLWSLRRTRVGRPLFYLYLVLAPMWIAYSVLGGLGRFRVVLAASVVAVAAAAWLGTRPRPTAMRQLAMYSTILAAVLTATTGIDAATGSSSADVADTEAEGERGDPDLPNVYHVVLDMFQTEMFETQLDDQTRNDLGGFTYFPDTRTEWGRTHLSMSSLYSTDDWDYEQPLDLRMAATYTGDTSAVTKLEEAGYQTTGWIHSTSFYGDQTPFDVMHLTDDLPDAVPASVKPRLASTLWVYSQLPPRASRALLEEEAFAMLEDNAFLPDSFTTAAPLTMAAAIDQEADLPAAGRYTLLHLLVPHVPYVLDADCRTRAVTEPVEQSACAMKLVDDLLDELERLDRFEDSTIVIHGDHGAYFELLDDELVALPDERESIEWVEARSRSVLLDQAVWRSARLPPRGEPVPRRIGRRAPNHLRLGRSRARCGRGPNIAAP